MKYNVGIDVGGTFTDFLVIGNSGQRAVHKISSTPEDPARAVIGGLQEIAGNLSMGVRQFIASIDLIVHGTTVTTNALLTRRGAETALLCTKGFRDVLPLRDGTREESYNNRLSVPIPLVPRRRRIGVAGRIDYKGDEVEQLSEDDVRHAAAFFREEAVEAVAICFIHSPANNSQEKRAAQILKEELPDIYTTISSELLPQVRLFDRTSTTALNSYVAPIMARYIRSLTNQLAEAAFSGVLLLMQSNGGVATPDEVSRRAVLSLLSGPASGPTAGLLTIEPLHLNDCITVDMGGTSFDSAVVKNGKPLVMTDGWVDRWRLALPMIDIHTIGAGGGSIAYVNEGGLLRVGPDSAGAEPGPACYGHGGSRATVTDADLVLGFVSPTSFLGGKMPLDVEAARRAIERDVAKPLSLDLLKAAAGIYDIVNVNMAAGVREITVKRGLDPRDFPLVVAGGAGPVHAAAIAREMGIPMLIVPRDSSIFCAAGMLVSDFKHDFVRSRKTLLTSLDSGELREIWARMRRDGLATLTREGLREAAAIFIPSIDMRYKGQWFELNVPVDASMLDAPDKAAIARAFHEQHDSLFGYYTPEMPVEVINLRLSAIGRTVKPPLQGVALGVGDTRAAITGTRPAWSQLQGRLLETPVYDGYRMGIGIKVSGAGIVELDNTTIVVPEEYELIVDGAGSFVVYLRSRAEDLIARIPALGKIAATSRATETATAAAQHSKSLAEQRGQELPSIKEGHI